MYINVAQLLKESIGSSRDYRIDERINEKGIHHIRGTITLTRTDRSILVKGDINATIKGTCSRCLNPVNHSVDVNLEDEYFPSVDISSGSSLPSKPERYTIDKNHILDLNDAIGQYTLLAMPMKLLCRPDCAGICPTCGDNLNQGDCPCSPKTYDQRWSKLIRLGKEGNV